MIEQERHTLDGDETLADSDYVLFREAGEGAKGSFRCADCGYGIVVTAALPACPMCGCTAWEESAWSPFGRSALL